MPRFFLSALLCLLVCTLCACDGGATTTPAGTPQSTLPGAPDEFTPTPDATLALSPAPHITTLAHGGLTLKEGYALAAPRIGAWQPDAVLVAAFNEEGNGMDATGRSTTWFYQAVAAGAGKRHTWQAKGTPDGAGTVSDSNDEDIGADAAKAQAARPLPLGSVIDTDKLMEIARQNGASTSTAPVGLAFAAPSNATDPLTYNLVFQDNADVLRLRVDAKSGTVLSSDKG